MSEGGRRGSGYGRGRLRGGRGGYGRGSQEDGEHGKARNEKRGETSKSCLVCEKNHRLIICPREFASSVWSQVTPHLNVQVMMH